MRLNMVVLTPIGKEKESMAHFKKYIIGHSHSTILVSRQSEGKFEWEIDCPDKHVSRLTKNCVRVEWALKKFFEKAIWTLKKSGTEITDETEMRELLGKDIITVKRLD